MKRSFGSTLVATMLFSMFSFLGVFSTARGASIVLNNSFSIGAGTSHPLSNRIAADVVTFQVPVLSAISVKVQHQRTLHEGVSDFDLHLALIDPSGQEVDHKTAITTGAPTTATLSAPASNFPGCNPKPWKVRMSCLAEQVNTVKVSGNVTLTYEASTLNLNIEGDLIDLNRGNQVTKTVFNIDKRCGVVAIKATWDTDGIPGLDSAKLTFILRRHDNTQAASMTANAFNALQSPKLSFTYRLSEADAEKAGDWKLEILNNSNFNTKKINVTGTFTPGCN